MAGVIGSISLNLAAKLTGTADLGTPVAPVNADKTISFKPGTGAIGMADVLWADDRTLASAGTESIDLAGVLAGLLGGTVTAAEITAIYIEAKAANTTDLLFFGAGANAFNGPLSGTTPKATVGPGDVFLATNAKGWTVTAATGDLIAVSNATGASASYRIVIIGRTVAA